MTAEEIRHLLRLEPLGFEGGFFCETYKSRWEVPAELLPQRTGGARSIGTAIYYLVTPDSFSALHRLPGTEIFHYYLGDPVEMLQLLPDGSASTVTLGNRLERGDQPQVVVRGGIWQGCRLAPGGKFALMGTTMSPGFDLADYEHGKRQPLVAQYPNHEELIQKYTRE
ncbi:MAG: cupin domain-containing protein [Candidatus Acidiferrales bacterium]